ncbi:MAG TPA: HAD family phosphatase [Acidimicrobiia bacterium]|nr:HAD family phosphatase [Acidimicrobiia bacterium]
MSIRVLYTDIDGTLVGPLGNLFWDSHRNPTLAAAEALVRAAREGLEVVGLTGRARAGMFEFARVVGLESWICELGGIRVYERGATVVHEHGAFPGTGVPTTELHRAVEVLLRSYPGRLEEHSPWNATRESSFLLRGDVPTAEAEDRLATAGFDWATLVDNGVIPHRYETLTVERVRAYHLLPRGVSKVAGVAADRAQRGLERAECAMVGDAAADLECRGEVGRCFLVRNGLDKDPSLQWVVEAGSGVEVTKSGHGEGFAEVVHRLLDER